MNAPTSPSQATFAQRIARWKIFLLPCALTLAVVWTFLPTLSGEWQWDDRSYFTENTTLHDPAGLWKIWCQPGIFIEYYPLSASVQWLQWQMWGKLTFGYHVANVLLHLLNAFLLWRLFGKLGLRLAWLGAFIFALHPMAVESVAWISQLKNTLSLAPFLLAMCAYVDYDEKKKSQAYFLALGLFLVSMLCKITMMMFPFVILLYALCKRGLINWHDTKASAPFFAVSLVLGATALWTGWNYEQVHGLESDPILGVFSRVALIGLTLSFYFFKFFWPVGLMPIYPQWKITPPTLTQFLPWLLIGSALCGLTWTRASVRRPVLLGLGFFIIILLPILGLKSISYMRFTWVMDHFLYIPQIGLIGLVIAALGYLEQQLPFSLRPYFLGAPLIVIGLLAVQSHAYAEYFQDEETLWTYELQRNPQAWPAYDNLGNALLRKGQVTKAKALYQQAMQIYPASAITRNNLGVAEEQLGNIDAARLYYREALKMAPGYLDAQKNLARLQAPARSSH